MVNLITINYALNEMYRLDQNALIEAVYVALRPLSFFKPSDVLVTLGKTSADVALSVRGKLASQARIDEALAQMSLALEQVTSNLLNSKAKNIALIITGRF